MSGGREVGKDAHKAQPSGAHSFLGNPQFAMTSQASHRLASVDPTVGPLANVFARLQVRNLLVMQLSGERQLS